MPTWQHFVLDSGVLIVHLAECPANIKKDRAKKDRADIFVPATVAGSGDTNFHLPSVLDASTSYL
jgi:hypothetical protein